MNTIFQAVNSGGKLRQRAVAFTSFKSGEGVSYVVESYAKQLAESTKQRVVVVDARAFHDLHPTDVHRVTDHCAETEIDNLKTLRAVEAVEASESNSEKGQMRISGWHSSPQIRQAYLDAIRQNFDYVIIDCPALSATSDVIALGPMVDAVVVVVEANRRRRHEPTTSQKVIESAGGKFLGYIVNRIPFPPSPWELSLLY